MLSASNTLVCVNVGEMCFIPMNQMSESEMYLFDPHEKCIQSNNETILDQGTPIQTSLVANTRVT